MANLYKIFGLEKFEHCDSRFISKTNATCVPGKNKELDEYSSMCLISSLFRSVDGILLSLQKDKNMDVLFAEEVLYELAPLLFDMASSAVPKEDKECKKTDKSDKVVLTKLDEEKFGDISKENTFGKVI